MSKCSSEYLKYRELKEIYGTREINELISLNQFKAECLKYGMNPIVAEINLYFEYTEDWQKDC